MVRLRCEEGTVFEKDETTGALGPGMAAARRTTIAFFFESYYGSPPESEWGGRGGVIARIMHRVGVPEGSKALVRKVLEDVVAAQEEGDAYDARLGLSGIGRQAKITREMAEARVVFTAMEAGVGITETTVMVNEFRAEKDEDSAPVSWSAVKRFIHTCGVVRIHKRQQKKSGKDDSATVWACCRLAQALEIQSRFAPAAAAAVAPGAVAAVPGAAVAAVPGAAAVATAPGAVAVAAAPTVAAAVAPGAAPGAVAAPANAK